MIPLIIISLSYHIIIIINPLSAMNGYLIFQTGTMEIPNYEYHYLDINMLTFKNLIEETEDLPSVPQIQL